MPGGEAPAPTAEHHRGRRRPPGGAMLRREGRPPPQPHGPRPRRRTVGDDNLSPIPTGDRLFVDMWWMGNTSEP